MTPIVVIGGSAGSIHALQVVFGSLPADLPAPVLVVVHLPPQSPSVLPDILARAGPLPASHARHGERLQDGRIYVAPPGRHLLVARGRAELSVGPRQNRHRPAVDALFTSAARHYGPATTAVVLSGALDDGATGAMAVAAQDGTVLVQDPDDADVPSMPRATLAAVRRARPAPADALGGLIAARLSSQDRPAQHPQEVENMSPPRRAAALGCPECHGGMFESAPGTATFICHVGHIWSPDSLLSADSETVEASLYNAASKLLEQALVHRRLAELSLEADDSPDPEQHASEIERHRRAAEAAERRADRIQALIEELASEDAFDRAGEQG